MASKVWERRENESVQAYEAFERYLLMEPEQRSTKAVGKRLGKSAGLIERWCTTHEWVDRTRAWDNEVYRKAIAKEHGAAITRQRNMLIRHRRVGRTALELALKIMTDKPESVTAAQLYQLMRGGQQLELSSVQGPLVKLAMSGDRVPLAKDDDGKPPPPEPQQPNVPMMPRIEIEIMGGLPQDALKAEMLGWYDKPGEVD